MKDSYQEIIWGCVVKQTVLAKFQINIKIIGHMCYNVNKYCSKNYEKLFLTISVTKVL